MSADTPQTTAPTDGLAPPLPVGWGDTHWIPHQPSTWPWRFAELTRPVEFREWVGHRRDPKTQEPIFVHRLVPAGTKVKVVMVSRFGDVGITDDLAAESGYAARVLFSSLEPCEHG